MVSYLFLDETFVIQLNCIQLTFLINVVFSCSTFSSSYCMKSDVDGEIILPLSVNKRNGTVPLPCSGFTILILHVGNGS